MHREKQLDEEGNLLEKPLNANEVRRRKKIAAVRNKVEDLIQRAKNSDEEIDFLATILTNIDASFGQIVPTTVQAIQEEYESLLVAEF
jgi:tRNA C32,U32 (ribose-2'-O)-methylase TrmJ